MSLKAFLEKPLKVRLLRGFVLAFSIAAFTYVTPTPYTLRAPGKPQAVSEMIKLETETYPARGQFLLPTVVSEPATVLYCIYSMLDPNAVLVLDKETGSQAQSPGGDQRQMAISQYVSSLVALKALGHPVRGEFEGLEILSVDPNSPNKDRLQSGDLLIGLDDEELGSFRDFRRLVSDTEPGQLLKCKLVRESKEVGLDLDVFRPSDRSLIGVRLKPRYIQQVFPFEIRFRSGDTVGASGGLVFALEIYNQLTQDDITKGRRVAATGTLDHRGRVGPIEGLEFKIRGAQLAGADLFLIPKANSPELSWLPESVKVIPVENFNEALRVLKTYKD